MKNILLFIIYFTISTFFFGFFLKFTRITPPILKYFDSKYGSLNRKNLKYLKCVEGLFIGNTNNEGRFRENYPPRKTDKKTLRILLLGDSFVEGIDVFPHNHFAQYLEDSLGKRLNRKVEVINYGRGNSTIHSMAYYFFDYISKNIDFDIVLVFTEGRDVLNLGKSFSISSSCLVLDSNNTFAVAADWKKSPEYLLDNKLTSVPLLKYYSSSSYFRLLYRAWAKTKTEGIGSLTFGKLYETHKIEQNYGSTYTAEVCFLTKKIYDTLYNYKKAQVIFVLRDKPTYTPAIIEYMKTSKYKYINLADTFNGFLIKNTNIDAYYFKATKSYGGHWNNDGHKTVGCYLTNKIFENIDTYKMPNFEKE